MKKIIKKHYKMIIGLVIGILISATVVYAAQTVLSSDEVSYNNETSGGSSNTVQGAIDDLYNKVNSCKEYIPNDNPNRNIVKAYKYDENKDSSTYCITGDEASCFITGCYDNKAEDSCPSGTIIEYKVNDNSENNIIRFHVVHDDGKVMTLQSQKDTVYNVAWYDVDTNNQGPLTALEKLEKATENWNNVNELNYSIGDKDSTLGYSGCDEDVVCKWNIYKLIKEKVKARMITVQEAFALGCKSDSTSRNCPIWMYNYLLNSTDIGGTQNDNIGSTSYFTMSAFINDTRVMFHLFCGRIYRQYVNSKSSARAVVEINK